MKRDYNKCDQMLGKKVAQIVIIFAQKVATTVYA